MSVFLKATITYVNCFSSLEIMLYQQMPKKTVSGNVGNKNYKQRPFP